MFSDRIFPSLLGNSTNLLLLGSLSSGQFTWQVKTCVSLQTKARGDGKLCSDWSIRLSHSLLVCLHVYKKLKVVDLSSKN